ncbi:MAG: hypothetical protein QM664_14005 [Flavihumibacter sp.]
MSTQDPFAAGEKKKLPTFLNVLTILTFVGCFFALISMPLAGWLIGFTKKAIENPEYADKMKPADLENAEKGIRTFEAMQANSTSLWIITLVSVGLCVYGAIQMRKLKKEGFYTYTIGEILPLLATGLVIGFANQFPTTQSVISSVGIALLFIILYATQLKKMN